MVEHTPDGRYILLDARRWRATDPLIPEDRQAELRKNLMAWRREVGATTGAAQRRARSSVQAAKEAVGERARRGGSRPTRSVGTAGPPTSRARRARPEPTLRRANAS